MEEAKGLLSRGCFKKSENGAILCAITCTVLTVIACSCNVTLPVQSSIFDEVEIVSCQSMEQDGPVLITQVFTDPEKQGCVYVDARLEDSAADVLTPGELILFESAWYRDEQVLGGRSIASPVLPDRRVAISDCITAPNGDALPTGQYRVEIKQDSVKIGEVEFRVE